MEYKGFKINLKELGEAFTAMAAAITALATLWLTVKGNRKREEHNAKKIDDKSP